METENKDFTPPLRQADVSCRNDFDDDDYEDDDDFQCCADCDLPDACSDFGCAIKKGIAKPWWAFNYGS